MIQQRRGNIGYEQLRNGGVTVLTANYTVIESDSRKILTMNSALAKTITLPAAIPNILWAIHITNVGTGILTVSRNGLNIDGAAANITLTQFQSVTIYTDGSNYFSDRGLSSGGVLLQTNTVNNGSQTTLNLIQGAGITVTDGGTGGVTIAATGAVGNAYPYVNLTPPSTSGFSWTNQGSSAVAVNNNILSMTSVGTGSDQLRYFKTTLPSTPWTVIAAFIPTCAISSFGQGGFSEGLAFSDGTKFRTFWVAYNPHAVPDLSIQGYDNTTTFQAGQNRVANRSLAMPIVWLKVHDDGTNRTYHYSIDPTNVGWQQIDSETHTNYLTPTTAGYIQDVYTGGLNGITMLGMPWLSFQLLNI